MVPSIALGASLACALAASTACDEPPQLKQLGDTASAISDAGSSSIAIADAGTTPGEPAHTIDASRSSTPAGSAAGAGGAEAGRGVVDASHADLPSPTMHEAIADYPHWTKLQDEPQAISAQIFTLCRPPSRAETAFTESVHGHNLSLLDWANAPAVRGLAASGEPEFPIGAAIVKQKLTGAGASAKLVALGIMIKRADGFDPAHGDWEFGYWDEAGGLSSGAEAARACGGCHAGSRTDFVFADQSWRTAP